MVNLPSPDDHDADTAYDELADTWPTDRPSRRRRARDQRRTKTKRVTVRPVRREQPDVEHMSRALLAAHREQPDVEHMSRALLAAHRELTQAQAERDAQSTTDKSTKDTNSGTDDSEGRS